MQILVLPILASKFCVKFLLNDFINLVITKVPVDSTTTQYHWVVVLVLELYLSRYSILPSRRG